MEKNYLTQPGYQERIIDGKISKLLQTFGAVSIEGPKWCGKTWTALNHCRSQAYLGKRQPNRGIDNDYQIFLTNPSLILDRTKPVLLDEWQDVPAAWDTVRYECDFQNQPGLYVLTGSAAPADPSQISHSGAGRIARVNMHTMSLYESGDSTGDVSLSNLFSGKIESKEVQATPYQRLAEFIVRGGWPVAVKNKSVSNLIAESYLEDTVGSNISFDGIRRDPGKMRFLIRSLARNESTIVSNKTLASDIDEYEGIGKNTVTDYLSVLNSLHLLEDQPAYSTNNRSPERVGVSKKRHFADTSLAVAALGLDVEGVMNDVNTFGFLFESLVEHDLRVYIESLGGNLYHYRNNVSGLEVDAIVELRNGDYGAIEIKLGTDDISGAMEKLKKFSETEVKKKPKFMAVICGLCSTITIRDGIYVFPLTTLKN